MSKGQRGNKEAKKPKKAKVPAQAADPVAGLPAMSTAAPGSPHRPK